MERKLMTMYQDLVANWEVLATTDPLSSPMISHGNKGGNEIAEPGMEDEV
jgi:hypothetical protein